MQLSDRIKLAREQVGLNQAELANRIGVSGNAVCKLESGSSKALRSTTLMRMANVLGQSAEWLADGTGSFAEVAPLPKAEKIKLSEDERNLVESFRTMTDADRKVVIRMIHALAKGK